MQVNAIQIAKAGAPGVMKWQTVELGRPGPDEALVRHTAVGLNYIDTYMRSGLYPLALPSGIGLEAAGVVERVGRGVKHVKAGDRVAYAGGPPGAYAEARMMPGLTPKAMWGWETGGWPSLISHPLDTSLWRTKIALSGSPTTVRSTTSKSCGRS